MVVVQQKWQGVGAGYRSPGLPILSDVDLSVEVLPCQCFVVAVDIITEMHSPIGRGPSCEVNQVDR
jgi:hypothetical protein